MLDYVTLFHAICSMFSYTFVTSFIMYQNHILAAAVLYDMTALDDLYKIDNYHSRNI